ncbi:MAG: DUF3696 domain-containing protein [Anaerolineaceae bacterium]|nr:DUF3696 domain-containing protein [Anaerolineaceae bacterium]
MFTNLRMVNFKSWADTGDVRLAPLTVLFGGNSTGKSGLLQMLLLLKQTTESRDRNQVLQTGTDDPRSYVELGTPSEIAHFDEKEMGFAVEWNWPEEEHRNHPLSYIKAGYTKESEICSLRLDTTIHAVHKPAFPTLVSYSQGQSECEELRVWVRQQDGSAYPYGYEVGITFGERDEKLAPGDRGPTHVVLPTKCYSFPQSAKSMLSPHAYLSDDLEWKFEEQFQRLHYLGPLREYPLRVYTWAGERPVNVGIRGERAVQALLAAGLNDKVFGQLGKLELAQSFEVRPLAEGDILYEVRLRSHLAAHEVLLPDVGFGVSQVLPVLVQCLYAPEHSTIILEHPDLHLHPSAQVGLADFLIDVMRQRNLQLIVESHSEHLIRRLQRRTAEEALDPEDVALYFCDIHDGVSQLELLQLDKYGRISNWPDGFFGDMTGDVVKVLKKGLSKKIATNA